MIDDSRANLMGRSEFIEELDITSLQEQQRQAFERQAVSNREALQLDELWQASLYRAWLLIRPKN